MDRTLEDVRDYYGGPVINSPPFYSVPLDASPEAPQCSP
jgi:hypothetical protein